MMFNPYRSPILRFCLVLLGIALLSNMAEAVERNPFATPHGWVGLMTDPAVKADLKFTVEQTGKITAIIGSLGGKPDEAAEAMREHLTEEQLVRIQELDWQREGGYALLDPKISKPLAITKEQEEQLAKAVIVNAAENKKMRDFMARARFRSHQAVLDYVAKHRKPANERMFKVLTKEQQAKLKELLGKPLSKKKAAK